MFENTIAVGTAGQLVRLVHDPAVVGMTTGAHKKAGPFTLIQLELGPNDRPFKRLEKLELVPEGLEPIEELILSGRLGSPDDLRRVIAYHKIRGDLTDILYSMESSRTDYYAHQFKPVLKFIDSTNGRILIADEVGLGKTIEATYIWKEVQAREGGKRLLIVCPSMLREKWQSDLSRLFGIDADIFGAKDVLSRFESAVRRPDTASFAIITSLEGLRPGKQFDELPDGKRRPRDQIAAMMRQIDVDGDEPLLDLVIFDEAHYLRNPTTQSHLLARLLIEASKHTVMLSATPVQIGSENLFNLFKLLDPDQIVNSDEFDQMLKSNAPLVRAQQAIWSNPPDLESASQALEQALDTEYFAGDSAIVAAQKEIASKSNLSPLKRVEIGRRLESHSLIGHYITRTRKREVEENRVERTAQVLSIEFTELERRIYDGVTTALREGARGKKGVALFSIIVRQRQMASSLVAAIHGWRENGSLSDILWEDIGAISEANTAEDDLGLSGADGAWSGIGKSEIMDLEANDSKYNKLRDEFLIPFFLEDQKEKVIIFAFFRGTLTYLERRLKRDGFKTGLLVGGQGKQGQTVLKAFADPNGPQILLSSEVGSEGIDLQFCRVVVNYDLPWNPMKVEQRIGRVDRLGQKAERILVINLTVDDTIEDRILMRLYDRIRIFKESIGDLEDILGEISEDLLAVIFDPDLTDEERDRRALQSELAVENKRRIQSDLENQAINLVGFSNYLLDSVNTARKLGRWLSAEEMLAVVDDFFRLHYPGTTIQSVEADAVTADIQLSNDAKAALGNFIDKVRPARRSQMSRSNAAIRCVFDPRKSGDVARSTELVDPTHPLIGWIQSEYSASDRGLHPAISMEINSKQTELPKGDYVFACQKWALNGLRKEASLAFRAVRADTLELMDPLDAEYLVIHGSHSGVPIPMASISDGFKTQCVTAYRSCLNALDEGFGFKVEGFEEENNARCAQQRRSAERLAKRKIADLERRIVTLRARGNTRQIAAFDGQIRKQRDLLQEKLRRMGAHEDVDIAVNDVAGGLVRVV
jgi:superfamily II DNA or RNA helicase